MILAGYEEKFKTNVIVSSDGMNMWTSPATFKSSCDMVIRLYPFDSQSCGLGFGSWTFDSKLLRIINKDGKHSKSGLDAKINFLDQFNAKRKMFYIL